MATDRQLAYWKRRAHRAEQQLVFETEHTASTQRWAERAFDERSLLEQRCTFLYGVARSLGASHLELMGGVTRASAAKWMEHLSRQIRYHRTQRLKISLIDAAAELGFVKTYLHEMETGRRIPTEEQMAALEVWLSKETDHEDPKV